MSFLDDLQRDRAARLAAQFQARHAETPQTPPLGLIQRSVPEIAGTVLTDDYLISIIERQDTIPERSRLGTPSVEGYIHASSLLDMCARQQVIANLHRPPALLNNVSSADRVVWALGRAAEKHVRRQVINGLQMRDTFGRWSCHCPRWERSVRQGFYDDDIRCGHCAQKLDKYREITLFDHANKIAGNPDLIFRHMQKYVCTEVKSIKGEEFKELRVPLNVHVLQAILYRHLLLLTGMPVADVVVIFYVNKHYARRRRRAEGEAPERSPVYKEFHVDATLPMYQNELARMLSIAAEVRDHMRVGMVPERTLCTNSSCSRARECPVAATCFNL